MNIAVILTAGGLSTRLALGIKKEFYLFPDGKSVLSTCAESFFSFFLQNPLYTLSSLIVTLPQDKIEEGQNSFYTGNTKAQCSSLHISPSFITGGVTRQKSVYLALSHIQSTSNDSSFVLIHDAARPFVTTKLISSVISTSVKHKTCVPVIEATDTLKKIDIKTGLICEHLERESFVCVQTPQAFAFPQILTAHKTAALSNKKYTDDSEIWNDYYSMNTPNNKVHTCKGEIENIKITYATDLSFIRGQKT